MDEDTTLVFRFEKPVPDEFGKLAEASLVNFRSEPEKQFADPFTIFLVSAGIVALGKFIVDLCEKLKGGMVIDLGKEPPEIERTNTVPAGWVVVLAKDRGRVTIEVHDAPKDACERLLAEVIKGVFSSAKDLADEAIKHLGSDRVKLDPEA